MRDFSRRLWVRRVLLGFFAATLIAATPGRAYAGCMEEAIESCRKDFPNTSEKLIGILGWCYIIRTAMCALLDPPEDS